MTPEKVIQHLVSGASLRSECGSEYDVPEYWIERRYGQVDQSVIARLLRDGFIESRNRCYILTDAGHRAYMRSTDELGDGKLRAPVETKVGCPVCGRVLGHEDYCSSVNTSAMQGSFGVHASTSGATHKGVVDEPCSIKPGDNNA